MNPYVRHPRNCIAALLKGVPMPYNPDPGHCAKCTEPPAYLGVFGDTYQALCEAHAREFRLRYGLTAVAQPEPAPAPAPIRRKRTTSKKGAL
jgi:hypothetical protein